MDEQQAQALWPWLAVQKALRQPLSSAIASLTEDEARYMLTVIQGMDGPLNQQLEEWGLPPLEGPGFWKGEILPLLKKRLAPKSAPRSYSPRYESFKDIKARLDISEVAGRFTELRPSGRRYKGLCPLHDEDRASFIVYPVTQSFYCFGCGHGGDVIDLTRLLMEFGKWQAR